MAVMVTSDQPGMTQEMYERASAEILPLLTKRPGFITHASWPIEGGWHVMEIWESEAEQSAAAMEIVVPRLPADMLLADMKVQPLHSLVTMDRDNWEPVG